MLINLKIKKLLNLELKRQQNHVELIASENYVSKKILFLLGSILTNKYCEGYPGKRYYGGCEYIDEIEKLSIKTLNKIFGSEHANVQPHSGSQANAAVYFALLNVDDIVLAMDLSSGGHLTHGSRVNFSGKIYNFFNYSVNKKTEILDYEEIEKIALKIKPKLIVAGASSYSRIIDFKKFRNIADKVGAYLMVDMAHISGLVAAKLHPNPVLYADVVTSTTHKTLRGPRGGFILCKKELAKKIDSAVFPGIQGGPLENIIVAKAQSFFDVLSNRFIKYQKQVILNSKVLSNIFINKGYKVISNGTDNHLLMLDVKKSFNILGNEAELLLQKVGIICNKNVIPYDSEKPFITSGIRLGTPAMTTRGFKEKEFEIIGNIIIDVLKNKNDLKIINYNYKKILNLLKKFPIYKKIKY